MNTQVATMEKDLPANAQEVVSFIQLIERASRDPSVDIDKMERLLQMQERMMNRQAETAFNAALAAMQTELPMIPRHGEIPSPFAYAPDHTVYEYQGQPVIVVETAHKVYDVFAVAEPIRPLDI